MKIQLHNVFHNRTAYFLARGISEKGGTCRISRNVMRRIENTLCPHGMKHCSCWPMIEAHRVKMGIVDFGSRNKTALVGIMPKEA